MKALLKCTSLVFALTSGIGLAAPPAQLNPQLSAKIKKLILAEPLTFACPVVSATAAIGVIAPWTQKNFTKAGLTAQSAYTTPGVSHDSCWCVYKALSDHVAGSETNFLLERESTPGKPVCQADSAKMSFSCYSLKPGEFY